MSLWAIPKTNFIKGNTILEDFRISMERGSSLGLKFKHLTKIINLQPRFNQVTNIQDMVINMEGLAISQGARLISLLVQDWENLKSPISQSLIKIFLKPNLHLDS